MWWVSQWGSQCASSRRRPSWTGGRKAFIVNVEVDRTPRRGGVGLSGGCCGGGCRIVAARRAVGPGRWGDVVNKEIW